MRLLVLASALAFVAAPPHLASAQTPPASPAPQQTAHPAPPTRDPHTPGLRRRQGTARRRRARRPTRTATSSSAPRTPPRPEMTAHDDRAQGHGHRVHHELRPTARSTPASRATKAPSARPIPTTPPSSIVTTSHPAPYTRKVAVYVPKQYVPGTDAPFIVGADGPDRLLFTALDNLIAENKAARR